MNTEHDYIPWERRLTRLEVTVKMIGVGVLSLFILNVGTWFDLKAEMKHFISRVSALEMYQHKVEVERAGRKAHTDRELKRLDERLDKVEARK